MLCLVNLLSRFVCAYLFTVVIGLNIGAGIVSIYFAYYIQTELSFSAFSLFLRNEIAWVAYVAALTGGSLVLAAQALAIVMMTPCQRKWMYYIYAPIQLLSFAVLMGAGLYLRYSGEVGAQVVKDYCSDTFERWTHLRYG